MVGHTMSQTTKVVDLAACSLEAFGQRLSYFFVLNSFVRRIVHDVIERHPAYYPLYMLLSW